MSLEKVVFDRLVKLKTAAITFADVVTVAQSMSAAEKDDFAKTLMKDDCKACAMLSVRVKNSINTQAQSETTTLINDDALTLAEIKTQLQL
jgi:beta-mannanase